MLLPNPPVPIVAHGLTAEQCVLVANIFLTWGAAEDELSRALMLTYQSPDEDVANDLFGYLDCVKKRDLLNRVLRRRDPTHHALSILSEIGKACDRWKDDRSAIARGHEENSAGISRLKSKPPHAAKKLTEVLNRANWLYLACLEVRRMLAGGPPDGPLPRRPA